MKFTRAPAVPALESPAAPAICLAVYDEMLLHLGSQRHCGLAEADDFRHVLDANRLAEAARRLLPETDAKQAVALCLPPHEFIATRLLLPGVDAANLANAARLQLPMILPGVTEPLLAAVWPRQENSDHAHVVLWLPAARADELFQAFYQYGLFLALLLPRPLAGLQAEMCQVYEEDRDTSTFVDWDGGALRRWLYLPKQECEDQEFCGQFEQAIDDAGQEPPRRCLTTQDDWQKLKALPEAACRYGFTPPGAQRQSAAQRRRRRRYWLTAAAVLIIGGLVAVVGNFYYRYYQLSRELAELRERTQEISQQRAEILDIEEKTGAIVKFPRQELLGILDKLNEIVPKNSWISSLRIDAGMVEIEGSSPTPAAILEALTAHPSFAEVAYNKPLQGDRFGIKFRLAGVDVPAYLQEYFPSEAAQ